MHHAHIVNDYIVKTIYIQKLERQSTIHTQTVLYIKMQPGIYYINIYIMAK